MKAGQLEIEILANVARLQQDMERVKRSVGDMSNDVGRKARAANDNLRSIGRGSGAGVQEFSRDVAQLKSAIDPAWAALQRYKEQVDLLRRAQAQGAIGQREYIAQVRQAKSEFQSAGSGVIASAGAQRAGMQQLTAQIGDMATMFALGARPMQIFASQGAQVIGAIQLMSGGASRFATFMAGPWGAALTAATLILAPLIGKLFETKDATKEVEFASYGLSDAQSILGQVMDLTTGKIITQSNALWGNARAQAAAAQVAARKQQFEASTEMRSIRKGTIELQGGMGGGLRFARVGDPTADILSAFQEGTLSVTEAERGLRSLMETGVATEDQYVRAAEAVTKFGVAAENIKLFQDLQKGLGGDKSALGQFLTPSNRRTRSGSDTDRRAETLAREAEATESLIRGLGLLADAYLESDAAAMKAEITAKATEQGIKKQADVVEFVARQMRLSVAQRTADAAKEVASLRAQADAQANLNKSMIAGGLSYEDAAQFMKDEADLRPYLTALAVAEGEAKEKLAGVIAKLREEQKRSNAEAALTKAIQDRQNYQRQVIDPLEREAKVLGVVGWARERSLLQMEREAEIKPLLAKQTEALARGEYLLAEEIGRQIALIEKRYGLTIQMGDWSDADQKARDELEAYNDALRETIGLLEQLGGFGGVLAGILGFVSGQTTGLRGPIGDLLNTRTGTKADPETGKPIASTLADELREIFKLNGEFGKTMTSLLQGAGTGMVAANALGFNSKGSQIGSALGGALGKVAGEALGKAVGGTLGKALGPLGSIAGGLLGGALGSLLSKTPKGVANIGNVNGALGVSSTAGNSNSRIAAASKSANAIIDSLESIASQLGASIDSSKGSVSIGIRKGSFRVDPTGKGATKLKKGAIDFGEDAEAAAYYAMMDLIKDGVLVGLRAGTERLLRNADDLEAGLAKALAFENVFKELKEKLDPLGAAFDEIGREAAKLQAIFAEAGATTAEYAQLEQLLQLKREDAIERAQQEAVDKLSERREMEIRILELLGREQDAIAASRELELAGLKASLKPLQSMIYQLEDARTIIERFGPLAADLRAFKQELLGSQTANSFAAIARQFREVSALAKGGDADALGKLRGSAGEFLEAAKENARTSLDYRRAVGEVLASVDSGIFAADTQVEYAQMQIDAIGAQTDILVSIREELDKSQAAIAANTAKIASVLQRFEGDGMPLRPEADTPLYIRLPDGETLQVEVAP